jgi:hypothetical protein
MRLNLGRCPAAFGKSRKQKVESRNYETANN